MKYFYISCFLLSSFFTYKTLSAKENYTQYAFFMPQGAFEQNLTLDNIESMRPRQPKTTKTNSKQTQEKAPKITLPYVKRKITSPSTIVPKKTEETSQVKPEISNNAIAKTKETEETPPSLAISPDTLEKLKKYSLEDISQEKIEKKTPQKPSLVSHPLTQKGLSKMLSSVPYPNPSLPKFKQLYASYVMDLRIFNRRGKLPSNLTQERTLKKAGSNHRFEVK